MALTRAQHEKEEEEEVEARQKRVEEAEDAAEAERKRVGASGTGKVAEKIAGPKPTQLPAQPPLVKPLPEAQRPGPAKSEVKSASKPDEPKKG
jgi:hypothetical protein